VRDHSLARLAPESRHLAVGAHESSQRVRQARLVPGRERKPGLVDPLHVLRKVGHDRSDTGGHRLQEGQAQALAVRGRDVDVRGVEPAGHVVAPAEHVRVGACGVLDGRSQRPVADDEQSHPRPIRRPYRDERVLALVQ